jgi:hypothetical protein
VKIKARNFPFFNVRLDVKYILCSNMHSTCNVATPLWDKCEGEAHTPKSGKLESSGTPKNSELDFKGQNTLHWGVLYAIGNFLKCRCPK